MTTERPTGRTTDVGDDRVSEAYRDLAGERAPASLNERVLREARAHAGSGYSYWMGWLRPAAWVATVGLCLAIVIELTTTQVPDIGRTDLPASMAPSSAESARERLEGTTRDLDDAQPAPPAAADQRLTGEASAERDELRQQSPAQKSELDAVVVTGAGRDAPAAPAQPAEAVATAERTTEPSAAEPKSSADGDRFNITAAPILEKAADLARMREGPVQDPAGTGSLRSVALQANTDDADSTRQCDDDARAEPESWIACIEDIERRGGNADDEREALAAAFPDVELP